MRTNTFSQFSCTTPVLCHCTPYDDISHALTTDDPTCRFDRLHQPPIEIICSTPKPVRPLLLALAQTHAPRGKLPVGCCAS
jgi:hypothetical protein